MRARCVHSTWEQKPKAIAVLGITKLAPKPNQNSLSSPVRRLRKFFYKINRDFFVCLKVQEIKSPHSDFAKEFGSILLNDALWKLENGDARSVRAITGWDTCQDNHSAAGSSGVVGKCR